MTASGSVVGAPVLLLSFLASIDLFSSSLINVASVARAGLRPAGSVYTHRRPKSRVIGTRRTGERMPWANPGTGAKNHPRGMVGRTPWSAADAPVGPLALCMMLISLDR